MARRARWWICCALAATAAITVLAIVMQRAGYPVLQLPAPPTLANPFVRQVLAPVIGAAVMDHTMYAPLAGKECRADGTCATFKVIWFDATQRYEWMVRGARP